MAEMHIRSNDAARGQFLGDMIFLPLWLQPQCSAPQKLTENQFQKKNTHNHDDCEINKVMEKKPSPSLEKMIKSTNQ